MTRSHPTLWVLLLIVGFVGEAWCFVAGVWTLVLAFQSDVDRDQLFLFAGAWAMGWLLFLGLMLSALVRLLRIVSKQAPKAEAQM
jgi:hypothetical protein